MKFLSTLRRVRGEDRLAQLLNLTKEEYRQLSHSGLKKVDGLDGRTLYYYIQVSPLNPESLLAKIKMDRKRMVYFSPDYFDSTRMDFETRPILSAIG